MPLAYLAGAAINYEVVGDRGPWIALISRGLEPLGDFGSLARDIAGGGCRVLIHDRRNCGRSSFDLDNAAPDEDVWADDLAALLRHVGAAPAIVVGWSRGSRVAIRLALRHPEAACGLVLWGLSGGPVAVRFLEEFYFLRHMRAAEQGGMDAVSANDHFASLITEDPAKGPLLHELGVQRFLEAMARQRSAFLVNSDQPVMGVSDDELRSLRIPTAIVPYYDQMHPHEIAVHAHELIRESRFIDYDPTRRDIRARHVPEDQAAQDQTTIARIVCDFAACRQPPTGAEPSRLVRVKQALRALMPERPAVDDRDRAS